MALVIGNSDYIGSRNDLTNPANDARAVHTRVSDLGFVVAPLLLDASYRQMEEAIDRFVARLVKGDVALFYYAGHGIQIDGESYLIPVDFDANDRATAKRRAYSASVVFERIEERGTHLDIVILDACRKNPFRVWSRGPDQGLANINVSPTSRYAIAYATNPGQLADDTPGRPNSVFTEALIEALKQPGWDLARVFQDVKRRVRRESNGTQAPATTSSDDDFVFHVADKPDWDKAKGSRTIEPIKAFLQKHPNSPYAHLADPLMRSIGAWERIKTSQDPRDLKLYIEKYPQGAFVPVAHERLVRAQEELQRQRQQKEIEQRENRLRDEQQKAHSEEDEKGWDGIKTGCDAKPFEEYLKRAEPLHRAEAEQRLARIREEQQSWQAIREITDLGALEKHLAAGFCGSTYDLARQRLENLRWQTEEDERLWNTVRQTCAQDSLRGYLMRAPLGIHRAEAENALSQIEREKTSWEAIRLAKDPALFEQHINAGYCGESVEKAKQRLASIRAWERMQNTKDPNDFLAYAREYPDGAFADDARNRARQLEDSLKQEQARREQQLLSDEQNAWEAIRNECEVKRFIDYLSRQDFVTFRSQAEARIALIRREKVEWDRIRSSDEPAVLVAHIGQGFCGPTVAQARERLRQLELARLEGIQKSTPGGLRPGFPATNLIDRQDYVWIPKGKFKMGCVPADTRCELEEKPQHDVIISEACWLGRTEVDVTAYRRYVNDSPRTRKMPAPPFENRKWGLATHPMVNVTWEDARDYCRWAGGRLPAEAEWEYAARAGAADEIYPLNNENSREKANFYGKTGNDQFEYSSPVRSFDPNSFGLFDMAGNVWEWVNDWYDASYYDQYDQSQQVDPMGPRAGKEHVVRGGSFDSDPWKHLRISLRKGFHKPWNNIGMRCVLDDTPETRRRLGLAAP